MMVFRAMLGPEMDWEEPSIRNSNLLPVKAMGEVRLRSVLSWGMAGSTVHADLQGALAGVLVLGALDDGIHHTAQLVAQEDGEHGGRRLLGAQTVVVAGEGHGGP